LQQKEGKRRFRRCLFSFLRGHLRVATLFRPKPSVIAVGQCLLSTASQESLESTGITSSSYVIINGDVDSKIMCTPLKSFHHD